MSTVLMDRYILSGLVNQCYEINRTRLSGIADEWDFFRMVGEVVSAHLGDRVEYTQIYPEYLRRRLHMDPAELTNQQPSMGIFKPVITYRVYRKQPSSGSRFFSEISELRPKEFDVVPATIEYYGRTISGVIQVSIQHFDVLTYFEIWAEKNEELQNLVRDFERLMHIYTPVFMKNGIVRIAYWEAEQPRSELYSAQGINNYVVSYAIRVQQLTFNTAPIIERIVVNTYYGSYDN
ncbi:MAG TPA: hypothetical protein ENF25_01215 [Thermoprotei archaeon]|nr:hypothetical protein [Thermoprotei archaeon]